MSLRRHLLPTVATVLALLSPLAPAAASSNASALELPQGLETVPIVLTGAQLPTWAVPADQTIHPGGVGGAQCLGGQNGVPEPIASEDACTHNTFEDPVLSTGSLGAIEGPAIESITGWAYDTTSGWSQIPLQVDEMAVRYLSNNNSGFAVYSEVDQHRTYVFDREGFRFTDSAADDPCLAAPVGGQTFTPDSVPGLDTDDEIVFMAADAGVQAESQAGLPEGIAEALEVAVIDPDTAVVRGYVYVMRGEVAPAFDATNGYVQYERDADADVFEFSESSYDNYGAAAPGPYVDAATGECITAEEDWRQRRPRDGATVWTDRYRYRYDGRWLMTDWRVAANDDRDYGPDLVDQWKARAFQQRPGGETPCCGYEEEENNWGGSSILMGELAGPVRVIRETWGADSGTNVVRREFFYREEMRQRNFLRVHPITPLDGIYTQWDYNAGAVDTYFNPQNPDGVAIDGRNDDELGNSRMYVGQDGVAIRDDGLVVPGVVNGEVVVGDPGSASGNGSCAPDGACLNNDVDTADPRFSGLNQLLQWEQITGSNGTLVSRFHTEDVTAGGAAHAVAAFPYYRDDACFDDGTGSNPGRHLHRRGVDDGEFAFYDPDPTDAVDEQVARECWDVEAHGADSPDLDGDRFFQGSIGTHGLHLLFIVDSDNAHTTAPVTEIVAEQRMVVLPPTPENVGEAYAGSTEEQLIGVVGPRRPL